MTDKKCPQCGGPANHPVGSSACKRIGIQRTDKDKAFADYDVSVKLTARRRDFNAGWDAHAALTKDVLEVLNHALVQAECGVRRLRITINSLTEQDGKERK